jgi:hypothetical protein
VVLGNVPLRGRKLTYLGFAAPGGAFFYRPLASFKERAVTNPSTPDFDFTEEHLKVNQFGFSASQESDNDSVVGVNLSYLNARRGRAVARTGSPPVLEVADGNGFALDIGLQGRGDYLSWGLVFYNIPGILYWNLYDPDQLPVQVRGGVAFHPVPAFGFFTDYEKRYYRGGLDKPDFLHLGTELIVLPWLALRGGTYGDDLSDPDKTSYTAGFSAMSKERHQLDFALRTYRVQGEKVYNYFISIILPLPKSAVKG